MLLSLSLLFITLAIILHAGVLMSKVLKIDGKGGTVTFFIGYMSLQTTAAICSLVLPLNNTFRVSLVIVLALFSLTSREAQRSFYRSLRHEFKRKQSWLLVAILVVLGFALAAEITLYDAGLYHIQNIKWIQDYALVPGLGNIHGRFAFNSHFFLTSALFAFEWTKNGESILIYPLNTVVFFVTMQYLLSLAFHYLKTKQFERGLYYLIICSVAFILFTFWINSPSPDIISACMVLFVFTYALEHIKAKKAFHLLFVGALIGITLTIKLSSLFLILVLLPLFYGLEKKQKIEGVLIKMTLIGMLAIGPFVIRNGVTSGYAVYPTTKLDLLSVDWKIPKEKVAIENAHIKAWAKIPFKKAELVNKMTVLEWLPVWWGKKSLPFKGLLLLTALSFLMLPYMLVLHLTKEALALVIIGINIVFWFALAPDPRFIHGFLLLSSAIPLAFFGAFVLRIIKIKIVLKQSITLMYGVLILSFLSIRENKKDQFFHNLFWPQKMASHPLAIEDQPFIYSVPQEDNRCYNADLPCLPEPTLKVKMRGASLQEGFRPIQ